MVPAPMVIKGAEVPPLVSRADAGALQKVDAILAPATPCTAPLHRPADLHARWRRGAACAPTSVSTLSRSPSSACRSSPCRFRCAAADRRADHHRALARGHRAAYRLRRSKTRRGAAPGRKDRRNEVDLPEVVAEVTVAFERYEKALVTNDVDTLDALFRARSRAPSATASARTSTATARSQRSAPGALRPV